MEKLTGYLSGDLSSLALDLLEPYIHTGSAILLLGPTGAGKEHLARQLAHARWDALGKRKKSVAGKKFVAVNLGAMSPELIQGELLGYQRGAFTGATRDHEGVFEQAGEGTVFLDEIGDLPFHLQVQLLRILDDRHITPLGSTREEPVRCLIVAATNRVDVVEDKDKFRVDLRMRFQKTLELPGIERLDDYYAAIRAVIEQHNAECVGRGDAPIAGVTAAWLLHKNPSHFAVGNYRDLRNFILREAEYLRLSPVMRASPLVLGVRGLDNKPVPSPDVEAYMAELEVFRADLVRYQLVSGNEVRPDDLAFVRDLARSFSDQGTKDETLIRSLQGSLFEDLADFSFEDFLAAAEKLLVLPGVPLSITAEKWDTYYRLALSKQLGATYERYSAQMRRKYREGDDSSAEIFALYAEFQRCLGMRVTIPVEEIGIETAIRMADDYPWLLEIWDAILLFLVVPDLIDGEMLNDDSIRQHVRGQLARLMEVDAAPSAQVAEVGDGAPMMASDPALPGLFAADASQIVPLRALSAMYAKHVFEVFGRSKLKTERALGVSRVTLNKLLG